MGSPAVQPFGVETWNAHRIALGAAIHGGKGLSRPLQRPVRLDLVRLRGKFARIADDIACLHDRQRRAVFVDRAQGATPADRPVEAARSADQPGRSEDTREFDRLLFRFRGDGDKHREGHAPRRGD